MTTSPSSLDELARSVGPGHAIFFDPSRKVVRTVVPFRRAVAERPPVVRRVYPRLVLEADFAVSLLP